MDRSRQTGLKGAVYFKLYRGNRSAQVKSDRFDYNRQLWTENRFGQVRLV